MNNGFAPAPNPLSGERAPLVLRALKHLPQGDDRINPTEWRFLISGMSPGQSQMENPDPSWIEVMKLFSGKLFISAFLFFACLVSPLTAVFDQRIHLFRDGAPFLGTVPKLGCSLYTPVTSFMRIFCIPSVSCTSSLSCLALSWPTYAHWFR